MADTSTSPEVEVWLDPAGRPAELHYCGPIPAEAEWFPEGPGQLTPRRYELRMLDGSGVEGFTVFPLAPWSPYDAVYDVLVAGGWEAPAQTAAELCEHGLSAELCEGPGHYGADR